MRLKIVEEGGREEKYIMQKGEGRIVLLFRWEGKVGWNVLIVTLCLFSAQPHGKEKWDGMYS